MSDRHISAVHKLLKQQYPSQTGLQNTLELSNRFRWRSNSTDFVQIVHISQNHWVCVSNRLSPPGVCDVYDSLPPTYSSTLTTQVATMMKCSSPQFTLRYVDVQHQSGGDDCALFAVAFADALCAGADPHTLSFNQSLMRKHLQHCFEEGMITAFPTAAKPQRLHRHRVKSFRTIRMYCTCRLPWERQISQELGSLAECHHCKEWYHKICRNIPDIVYSDRKHFWSCGCEN